MTKFSHKDVLNEHKGAVYALCEGNQPHLFYSGGSDRYVIQWNLESMKAEKVVSKAPTTIVSLCYIAEYNLLLVGQIEGGVHVIDLTNNKELRYLKIHRGYIFDILFISSKNEVVFSSGDGSISIWSVPDFKLLYQTQIGEGKNRKMDYSPLRNEIAISSADGYVKTISTEDWSEKHEILGLESGVNSVLYYQDNLLIGTKNAHLHEVDLITQQKKEGIPAHNWAVYDLAYNASLGLIASASRDKTVKIWNKELKVLKRFEGFKDKGHTHSVNALLWSNYSNFLISAGDDKILRVWSIEM